MLNNLQNKSDVAAVRRALYAFYTKRRSGYGLDEQRSASIAEYARHVERAAGEKRLLLDFGCGNWRSPLQLARHGFHVTGLDVFSQSDLAQFTQRLSEVPQACLRTYDGQTPLPFDSGSFEIVSSLCVFEHLLDAGAVLTEFKRILKAGGRVVIQCPNWSGPNNCIRAMLVLMNGGGRYFHYENKREAVRGLGRSLLAPLRVKLRKDPHFEYIFPRMRDGSIMFETADDDAVHLCVPTSFKKWFARNGFKVIAYNRNAGSSCIVRTFNRMMPWYATTNLIVAEKV